MYTLYKKGGGGMKKVIGGRGKQYLILSNLENFLSMTGVSVATVLGTSYSTYKSWKSDNRQMTGTTLRLIDYIFVAKGTEVGVVFGI